jgi:hypothetical protein
MKKIFIGLITTLLYLNLFACAQQLVKTDLISLNENPEEYKGKEVVVIADLQDIFNDLEAYLGRKVELTGFVELDGFTGFNRWSFVLKDNEGRSARCYERGYRIDAWKIPEVALRRAERKNEKVVVVGDLQKGKRIELDWIEYEGQIINTDYKPPRFFF